MPKKMKWAMAQITLSVIAIVACVIWTAKADGWERGLAGSTTALGLAAWVHAAVVLLWPIWKDRR